MTLTSGTALIALPLALTLGLQGQVTLRAGLWENTISSTGQTATRNACITPEQEQNSKGTVDSMRASTEKSLARTGSCKLTEFSVAGTTQTVIMVCGKTSIKHQTTFHGDTFETTATTTTPAGVKSAVIKGRRLGDCPPGGAK